MDIQLQPTAFVVLSTGHGTMIVNRHDQAVFADGSGYGVGYQLFTTSFFDKKDGEFISSLLSLRKNNFGDNIVVLDGGANIGVHTIEWARFMYGWGKVIAIEAQERVYYALAGNIAINNCFNAFAMNVALGSEVGKIDIPVPDYHKNSSFGSLELKQRQRNEYIGQPISYNKENCKSVTMITIDSLELPRLDFIKLDVEGMEMEVLAGTKETILRCKPQMFIEHLKTDRTLLDNFLRQFEYKFIPIGIDTLAIHKSDPCLGILEKINKISFQG